MSEKTMNTKSWTMDILAYAAIVLLAGFFRFTVLNRLPLDDHEANLALQALNLSRGAPVLISGEPGYIALTTILFYLFEAAEFFARFWPALAGTLLTLMPLIFKERLGKLTALVFAVLIAFDPILIGISRSAEGSSLALLGLLAAAGFCLRDRPILSGVSFGLALSGGIGVWTGLIVLIILILLFRKDVGRLSNRFIIQAAAAAGVTLLILNTLFLTNAQGISAVGSSLVDFARSWANGDGAPLSAVGAAWLLSLFPFIVFAVWQTVEGSIRGDKRIKWLGIWAGSALILSLVNPSRQLSDLYWVSIPVLALAALKLTGWFRNQKIESRSVFMAEAGLVVALIVFSLLNLINLVNNPIPGGEDFRNRMIGVILPLVLLFGMTVLLAWGWSGESARKGLLAGMIVMAFLFTISNAWKAAGLGNHPELEVRRNAGIPVGEDELLASVSDISLAKTGIENRIDVQVVGLANSTLNWAFRNFEHARFISSFDSAATPSIVVTGIEQELNAIESYRGQKFLWQVTPDLKKMKFSDWLKWSLFRTAPVNETEFILWARNDLFPGVSLP